MSLLNDMLRDISQKHQVPDGVEGYDYSLLQSSSMARQKNTQKLGTWVAVLLVFVTVFFAVIGLRHLWQHKAASAVPPVSVEKTAPQQVENQAVASVVSVPPHSVSSQSVNTGSAQLQARIDDLMLQAERALTMDRLTSPIEDNAYGYYQKILSISPANEQAQQGLEKIAARYLAKAQEQQQLGNSQQMDAYLQRAKFVAPDYVQEQTAVQMAPVIELPTDNTSTTTAAAPSSVDEIKPDISTNQRQVAPQSKPNESAAEIHETVKSFKVAEAASTTATLRLNVAPNAEWKDEQLAQQARELIQQGKEAEALAMLKKFVVSEQAPVRSASLLIETYLQQGNIDAAQILLSRAVYLPPASSADFRAQILSGQGDNAAAIVLLEQHLADANDNESYRALLASLYHKTGQYQKSVTSYQSLLKSFGEKPAYWLGLALAHDGLSQPKDALQAYLRLREFPQLQPQVSSYIDQRIAALRSQ